MAVAKVILNGTTLIDVTQKTVTASTLLQGETALKNDGTDITGTLVPSVDPELQSKSVSYTPTTSQQTDSITADVGYDGLDQVDITINAVATGTAGTPTATKGTVSNHAISVTPSVTNTTGYITGGTINGTAVSVSASELVSGTLSITSSGTKDVTNYASASVASGSASTPATSITANPTISVSASGLITASVSGSKSVTPSVSAGYVASGTAGTVSVNGSATSQLTVYNGEHHQPVQQVEVQINSEGAYTVSLPSGASQSGNIVTIDPNGTFTIYGSFDLDMTSTDGTVTRQIVSIGSGTFEILVDAGASGGSISLYEMM